MRSWRAERLGVVVAAVLALLAVHTSAAAKPTSPDEAPSPTSEELSNSVHVYSIEGSVKVWGPAGSVSTLEAESTEGADTVLTLDSDILFDFGSADVDVNAAARLGELVADVPPGATVRVTGHTDSIGDDGSNLELSQRRAQAVAAAIAAARPDLVLDVQGRGETEPVAPNETGGEDNPEGREQNRRVEVRYAG
jgi:OmpA-OmpF porin, OOP family